MGVPIGNLMFLVRAILHKLSGSVSLKKNYWTYKGRWYPSHRFPDERTPIEAWSCASSATWGIMDAMDRTEGRARCVLLAPMLAPG